MVISWADHLGQPNLHLKARINTNKADMLLSLVYLVLHYRSYTGSEAVLRCSIDCVIDGVYSCNRV